jgi:hypothetical protein
MKKKPLVMRCSRTLRVRGGLIIVTVVSCFPSLDISRRDVESYCSRRLVALIELLWLKSFFGLGILRAS